jgi:hypothetical protein
MGSDKVMVAFLDREATGIAPTGRGKKVEPGPYRAIHLDGMDLSVVMLTEADGTFIAMMGLDFIDHMQEVLDGPYPLEWAAYYRANPDTLASWGEQNGRRP